MSLTKQFFSPPQTSAFRKQTFTLDYLNLEKCKCFLWKKYLLLQQKLGFPFKQDHMITRLYFTFRRNLHTPHLHPVIHLAFPFTSACCVNKVERWLSLGTQGDNQCSLLHLSDLFYGVFRIYATTQNTLSNKPCWNALHNQSMKTKPRAFQGFFANSVLQRTNFLFWKVNFTEIDSMLFKIDKII